MSTENDFIENIRGLMHSQAVNNYLEIFEHRLEPLAGGEQRVGILSDHEVRLWVLWTMAREDLAVKTQKTQSLVSDLENELKGSDTSAIVVIRAKHKPDTDMAQAEYTKAISHELGIRLILYGALVLAYGINPASGDESYEVRKGYVLVRVPDEPEDSAAIRWVRQRAVLAVMVTAFGR